MSRIDPLSRPETIVSNNNIFQKEIRQTGNNHNTTCLDLAMKRINLNNYINNLGQYNLVNFRIINNPERRVQYTFTDYAQPCPAGWTNQNGNCMNWWNYTGPCNAGQWVSGTRNCNWRFKSRTCFK
jgi:hypothetical protein